MARKEAGGIETLYGAHPILEQIRRAPASVRRVFVAPGAGGKAADVAKAATLAGIEVVREDPGRLRDVPRGAAHQGVAAFISAYSYADFDELVARKPPCLLLADQVTDPRNLGALMRSAEAAGAGGLILPRDRSAGVNPVAAKAAAGAVLPVTRVTNVARALEELKRAGYWAIGLDASAPQSVFDFTFPELSTLVVGSEGRGLRPLTRANCDSLVSIPMLGQVESLNVSVATAIALYERVRQARTTRGWPASQS
ncbi:MAG: 23S rRNA (guanosine(2251)-2'-O)-methyltransferase RlmB [Candidatus Binatia bacterium]